MKSIKFRKNGFTLIELLVVITIIAALAGIVMTNFLGVRERAKDSKKKAELNQIKSALRLYYNDYAKYPGYNGMSPNIVGCGPNGTTLCSASACSTTEFAAGGTDGCSTAPPNVPPNVYMKRFPRFSGTNYDWNYYVSGTDDFCLTTKLENSGDPDLLSTSPLKLKCTAACGANCPSDRYCLCAD